MGKADFSCLKIFSVADKTEFMQGSRFIGKKAINISEIIIYSFTQPCHTLCEPMDCSPPGFSVCEILQARILEWVVIPSSRGSSQPRD